MSRSQPSTREGAAPDPAYDAARAGEDAARRKQGPASAKARSTSGVVLAVVCLIIIALALIAFL